MPAQPTNQIQPWLLLAFILGMFVFVSYLFARLGGWSRLARDYRLDRGGGSHRRSFVSGGVGWVSYRSCLTVGGDARGLHLEVLPPFSLGHPPLCIPWSDVHDRVRERWFFISWDTFRVGPDRVKVRIQSSAMKPFDGYLPAARQG